jgi:hypothetical protein
MQILIFWGEYVVQFVNQTRSHFDKEHEQEKYQKGKIPMTRKIK